MMWMRSRVLAVLIAGISLIIAVSLAVGSLVDYKQNASGGISATGSATRDFTSDLIVWRGSFSAYGQSTTEAYASIQHDAGVVRDYLLSHNVPEESIVFSSVTIEPDYREIYNDYGNYVDSELKGYSLSQRLTIQSSDVEGIEVISRDITELIGSGVNFYSESPEYYYTKLGELKLELIDAATADAKARVDIMAEQSGGKVGKLLSADLGTFQITAQNSAEDSYVAGGAFNTWSREKTMFISVRLHYALR
ncbi:SIMPL domain-containing protein [Oscillibacter sp.]|uniref:SIMPL domain-containing protein n=1 Tax=Oscillibacter sp. TaxID=1945593 RepID=UPI00289A031C|nr:SIMPL domain-containing protein [Oscillibacter sp.]